MGKPKPERETADLELVQKVGEEDAAAESDNRPDDQQKSRDVQISPPVVHPRELTAIFSLRVAGNRLVRVSQG